MSVSFSNTHELPLVCMADKNDINLSDWACRNVALVEEKLAEHGAILFRGFNVNNEDDFADVIDGLYGHILPYLERTSPRNHIARNIYTATDLVNDADIFLHNEHSYRLEFPMRVFFYCNKAPDQGGRTPIADTRRIFQRIPDEIRQEFFERKYCYTRNLRSGIGLDWQTVYQTDQKEEVEKYCLEHDIGFEWSSNNKVLRTHQVRDVITKHPTTNELCWFNHLTFFHFLTLPQNTQKLLRSIFKTDEGLPNNTYYGDGSPIPDSVIEILKNAYLAEEKSFAWKEKDVLLLDNMLASHGRQSFTGERKVYVGFTNMLDWDEVQTNTIVE